MDEQERIDGEEVEAHRRKAQSEDASDDDGGAEDADVEAHQLHRPPTSGG